MTSTYRNAGITMIAAYAGRRAQVLVHVGPRTDLRLDVLTGEVVGLAERIGQAEIKTATVDVVMRVDGRRLPVTFAASRVHAVRPDTAAPHPPHRARLTPSS